MTRKNFQPARNLLRLGAAALLFFVCTAASASKTSAQQIVDKTVAVVSDNVVEPQLITYSDLLWQLALQPDVPLSPPSSQDLNRALQVLVDQRLIALEAERLPTAAPSDEEVRAEIRRILNLFPSTAEFERRLRAVGFESVEDDNFRRMMEQRVAIEKYLDFRFRSFVVVTLEDESTYYRDVFTPNFRRRNPGVIVPPLEQVRAQINQILTERKIEEDIDRFLEDARRRAQVEVLFEV